MSALTLLAFLFFLHILQQCIKDHMTEMSTAPVVVMSASREGNEPLSKATLKIDKTGVERLEDETDKDYETNPYKSNIGPDANKMLRIDAEEHKPKRDNIYGKVYKKDENSFPGFESALNDNWINLNQVDRFEYK